MSPLTFTLPALLAGLALLPMAAAAPAPAPAELPFLTLDGYVSPRGPLPERGTAYVSELAMLLLRIADAQAAFFAGEEKPGAYFAFLVGALSVPLHESGLQHFRKLDRLGSRCLQSVQDAYEPHFRKLGLYMLGRCDRMSADRQALQLIASQDGLSLGLMQINVYAHPDYMRGWEFLSVPDTIKRGLDLLREGFEELVDHPEEYPCLEGETPLRRLIQGVWAGSYQSGDDSRSCRFARTGKAADPRDAKFARAIESVLALEGERAGLYARLLGGNELALYRQAIEGFLAAEAGADAKELQSRAEALRAELKKLEYSSKHWFHYNLPIRRGIVALEPGRKGVVRDWSREDARAVTDAAIKEGARVWIYDRFKGYSEAFEWYSIAPGLRRWVSARDVKLIGP